MISRNQLEDSSSQAGWMFADLFLALTVIFLATVSFIPSGGAGDSKNQNSSNTNSQLESRNPQNDANKVIALKKNELTLISSGFIGEYPVSSTSKFIQDFNEYVKLKDLPQETSILYLEVIGNTSEFGVSNDAGNLDALKFVINLRKVIPKNLTGTNTSINLSPEVGPGYVRIKLTFT